MNFISGLLTFTEGILTFISPCILPMLPIYLLYLGGQSEKEVGTAASKRSRLVLNSIGFVIGFTLIFLILGATVTSLGHFLAGHRSLLEKISGVAMVLFGLSFAGILRIGLLNTERRLDIRFDRLRFFGSIIFGAVFGFGWTPCLGAFLGSALALAGNSGTMLQGILLLLLYSLGLGIPFIIAAIAFERLKEAFRKIQEHGRAISIASGILLVLAGILVFTGSLKYLSYFI